MTIPKTVRVGSLSISPPLILAPMAEYTHSAFRRLLSEQGGYGALFTEMLSGTALHSENLLTSPYTKRGKDEGPVLYQLQISGQENLEAIFSKLKTVQPDGIDINLGCPAPDIKKRKSGTALFDDFERLRKTLHTCRELWSGPLTIKCRLGDGKLGWEERFTRRLALFEECKIDAITLHPRFSDEKLKRNARWNIFPWVVSQTGIPLIANGDIRSQRDVQKLLPDSGCKAVMIGRMAIMKPWIFKEICGESFCADYHQTWNKFCRYTIEDFGEEKALRKIKKFTLFFSQNFFFDHHFFTLINTASDLKTVLERAETFLQSNPKRSLF